MARVTLRNLAAHKIRLVLTAVAVILGVAFVAGTLVFTDTMNRKFDDLFDRIGENVAVDVRASRVVDSGDEGAPRPPLPQSVLALVRSVPGVKDPVGSVDGYAALVGRNGKVVGAGQNGPPQLGTNWSDDGVARLVSGRAPAAAGEVVVDRASAKKAGYAVGDQVTVLVKAGPRRATLVGTADIGDMMGATIVAFDTPTAQSLLLRPGYFSEIRMGSTGPDEATLRDRVARVLPSGTEAVTGAKLRDENKSAVASFMGFFRTFLLVFALISIFVGAFIIFNTFSMLVAQRTRELALLRAIGAARSQVTRAVIGEAVAVGFVGSTLGLGAGVGLAALLQSTTGGGGGLTFTATPVLWSYTVGIVVTVVSAYFPARRAAKVPPVAAMRDDVAMPQRSMRIRLAAGSLLTLVGAALITLGLFGHVSNAVVPVGVGAFAVFLGVALLAPVISRPVVRVLGWPFARLLRTPGRLARQNALRNPRRTAATASALMIGLALITAVNVLGSSMRSSVEAQVDKQFGADYVVEPTGAGGLAPELVARVKATGGVKDAGAMYSGSAKISGKRVRYTSGDTAEMLSGTRARLVSGSGALGRDGMLVDEATARKDSLSVGSAVPLLFPDGRTETLHVRGVYAKNQFLGGRVVAQGAYLAHTPDPAVDVIIVTADRADAATKAAIERTLSARPDVKVQDQSALKADARKQVDGFVTFLTILLIMSVVIAAVGVVNTLALSVIERTREIGLLRAIGISRRQLRRMIRAESVVIAVFGALLGIGIGVAFGAALQHALRDKGLSELSVPVGTLAGYLVVAAVIGVLAALWPAWRAGRMDVLKAISTE
ncbi:ABC transporter permease [Actinomadura logoneensis]|uniref:ABC transporter permease n=2 Tax=Actinomadura logoneensis TaxID=2293572 RepID=A0A372JLM7_9ACTN|nr:ABC transporter permease [Actinomadura logoneensis]